MQINETNWHFIVGLWWFWNVDKKSDVCLQCPRARVTTGRTITGFVMLSPLWKWICWSASNRSQFSGRKKGPWRGGGLNWITLNQPTGCATASLLSGFSCSVVVEHFGLVDLLVSAALELLLALEATMKPLIPPCTGLVNVPHPPPPSAPPLKIQSVAAECNLHPAVSLPLPPPHGFVILSAPF